MVALVKSTTTHAAIVTSWEHLPLRMRPAAPMSDDALWELCVANPDLRIERTADGEILIMPPTGGDTGIRNADLNFQLVGWARRDGSGVAFDSSTGFMLPNGAERAPDGSWMLKSRWEALTPEQRRKLVPGCPDFIVELGDRLDEQHAKLAEFIANGARLGWLIDPDHHQVHVYRPGLALQTLDRPLELSGDPELPGFVLDLRSIWS